VNPKGRTRAFQAGAVFSRVAPALHPMSIAPWSTTDGGQQQIKISSLRATQKALDPERVKHYLETPSDDPITVLRGRRGGPLIYDGHHRAAAAKKRGDKTITANVRRAG
jgi:hypothetical protein